MSLDPGAQSLVTKHTATSRKTEVHHMEIFDFAIDCFPFTVLWIGFLALNLMRKQEWP